MKRLLLTLLISAPVAAQPTVDTPAGPAAVITGAQEASEQARQQQNLAQEVSPEVVQRARGRTPPIATAEADPSVSVGTILVRVVDPEGRPVAGADVRIGIMKGDGSRDSIMGRTGSDGEYRESDLPAGSTQAYRVNVPYEGATYSCTPFRLEPDRGHRVLVRRIPVTRDSNSLLQSFGQTMLEYRNERLHVTEQAQLINLGDETIILDSDDMRIDLPSGFTAFQSQQSMTDQRIVPDDQGFTIRGSIPPGRATLIWGYDIPLSGTELHFSHGMPFRTYAYRVMTDAMPGMALEVDGFPEAEQHEGRDGRPLLVSQIDRAPTDDAFNHLSVTIRGIPGPGPMRWLALGGAFVLLFLGLLLATRGGDRAGALTRARTARKAQLIEAAAEVEQLFDASEVGPQFRERRMKEIVDELASLIRLDEATEASNAARAARSKKRNKPKKTKRV